MSDRRESDERSCSRGYQEYPKGQHFANRANEQVVRQRSTRWQERQPSRSVLAPPDTAQRWRERSSFAPHGREHPPHGFVFASDERVYESYPPGHRGRSPAGGGERQDSSPGSHEREGRILSAPAPEPVRSPMQTSKNFRSIEMYKCARERIDANAGDREVPRSAPAAVHAGGGSPGAHAESGHASLAQRGAQFHGELPGLPPVNADPRIRSKPVSEIEFSGGGKHPAYACSGQLTSGSPGPQKAGRSELPAAYDVRDHGPDRSSPGKQSRASFQNGGSSQLADRGNPEEADPITEFPDRAIQGSANAEYPSPRTSKRVDAATPSLAGAGGTGSRPSNCDVLRSINKPQIDLDMREVGRLRCATSAETTNSHQFAVAEGVAGKAAKRPELRSVPVPAVGSMKVWQASQENEPEPPAGKSSSRDASELKEAPKSEYGSLQSEPLRVANGRSTESRGDRGADERSPRRPEKQVTQVVAKEQHAVASGSAEHGIRNVSRSAGDTEPARAPSPEVQEVDVEVSAPGKPVLGSPAADPRTEAVVSRGTKQIHEAGVVAVDSPDDAVEDTSGHEGDDSNEKDDSWANLGKDYLSIVFDEKKVMARLERFGELSPKLRVINLGFCGLTSKDLSVLVTAIVKHGNVKELSLENNRLTDLPENFARIGDSVKLSSLILQSNSLSDVPCAIGKFQSLKILNLSRNKLKSVPTSLKDLPLLEMLNLSRNEIVSIPEGVLGTLKNLHLLRLDNNKLESLPDDLGMQNLKLKILDLSGNPDFCCGFPLAFRRLKSQLEKLFLDDTALFELMPRSMRDNKVDAIIELLAGVALEDLEAKLRPDSRGGKRRRLGSSSPPGSAKAAGGVEEVNVDECVGGRVEARESLSAGLDALPSVPRSRPLGSRRDFVFRR